MWHLFRGADLCSSGLFTQVTHPGILLHFMYFALRHTESCSGGVSTDWVCRDHLSQRPIRLQTAPTASMIITLINVCTLVNGSITFPVCWPLRALYQTRAGKLNMQPELLDDPLFLLSTAVGPNQVKWCNKGCKLNKSEESFTVSCVCEYTVTSTLQDSWTKHPNHLISSLFLRAWGSLMSVNCSELSFHDTFSLLMKTEHFQLHSRLHQERQQGAASLIFCLRTRRWSIINDCASPNVDQYVHIIQTTYCNTPATVIDNYCGGRIMKWFKKRSLCLRLLRQ